MIPIVRYSWGNIKMLCFSFKDAFGSYVWDWSWVFWGCLKRPFAVDGFQAMDCSAEISGAFGSTAEAVGSLPDMDPGNNVGIYGKLWE